MFYSFLLTNWRVVLVTRHLVQFQHLLWKCLGLASNAGYPVVKSLEIRDIFWFPFLISRRTSVVVLAALVQRSVSGMNIAAFSWQFLSFFCWCSLLFECFQLLHNFLICCVAKEMKELRRTGNFNLKWVAHELVRGIVQLFNIYAFSPHRFQ